jgi:aldehyde:ferredoxin oxidoreductase
MTVACQDVETGGIFIPELWVAEDRSETPSENDAGLTITAQPFRGWVNLAVLCAFTLDGGARLATAGLESPNAATGGEPSVEGLMGSGAGLLLLQRLGSVGGDQGRRTDTLPPRTGIPTDNGLRECRTMRPLGQLLDEGHQNEDWNPDSPLGTATLVRLAMRECACARLLGVGD